MKKVLSTLALCVMLLSAAAQNNADPVIFEIGGKQIHKSQFMKDFLKPNWPTLTPWVWIHPSICWMSWACTAGIWLPLI